MGTALTHSAWINAWTLQRACADLNILLHVPAGTRGFPLPVSRDPAGVDWIFFTEEASLRQVLDSPGPGRFLPERFNPDLLDDKWAFANFLAEQADGPAGLAQWSLESSDKARYPLLLKARHSWRGGSKLPRGWVCRDKADLQARLCQLDADGLARADFFLQEWLGDQKHSLLSVGGFFDVQDESRNLALVTERVASYGEGPSSSAMLVTVEDAHGLIPATYQVLRRMRFRGPFELEFLHVDGRSPIVELNPRFWMQHGLFWVLGNGLVKRYLGQETAEDRLPLGFQKLVWIDGPWLLKGMLHMDLRVWSCFFRCVVKHRHRPVICPTPAYLIALQIKRLFGCST